MLRQQSAFFVLQTGGVGVMRHMLGFVAIITIAAGCRDSVAPKVGGAPVEVVFSDASGRASVVKTGFAPIPVPDLDTTELFAPLADGMVTFSRARFSIFRFSTPGLTPLEERVEPAAILTPGAVSRDGRRLAYASALDSDVFLHVVDMVTGERDSLNVVTRTDLPAAPQIIYNVPIWSPSGDSVAFLLPNVLGMQILIYERASRRLEVKVMAVPTSTYFRLLEGRPHWSSSGTIRFLTQRTELEPYRLLDTLAVLRVDPRLSMPRTEVESRAVPPDSMSMDAVWSYSFNADGSATAFGMTSETRSAIMVMRKEKGTLETLLYSPSVRPMSIVVLP